jgi:NADPH:quinone reductase-like Zn-dependent oxidoreductase
MNVFAVELRVLSISPQQEHHLYHFPIDLQFKFAAMTTRKQRQCMQKGGPFETVAVPIPSLAPDELLLQQKVIALNDLDRKQRDLGILVSSWPHVLGIEGAGIVKAVGSAVTDLQPGDEALALEGGMAHGENWGGAYQDHVVVPARYTAKKPSNMSLEEAASLP